MRIRERVREGEREIMRVLISQRFYLGSFYVVTVAAFLCVCVPVCRLLRLLLLLLRMMVFGVDDRHLLGASTSLPLDSYRSCW